MRGAKDAEGAESLVGSGSDCGAGGVARAPARRGGCIAAVWHSASLPISRTHRCPVPGLWANEVCVRNGTRQIHGSLRVPLSRPLRVPGRVDNTCVGLGRCCHEGRRTGILAWPSAGVEDTVRGLPWGVDSAFVGDAGVKKWLNEARAAGGGLACGKLFSRLRWAIDRL